MIPLMLFMVVIIGIVIIIAVQIMTAPRINAMVWKHPENGGGVKLEWLKQKSGNQPFWIKLHWWQFNEKPIYLWYEEKLEDKKTGNTNFILYPYEPRPDTSASPNSLYDNVDWECAHDYWKSLNKLMETVKMGMAMVMVVVCIIGVIMLADMLNKKPPPKAEIPQQTITYVMENK